MTTTTNSTNTTHVQHPTPGARRRFVVALGAAALPLVAAGALVAMRSPDPATNSATMPAPTTVAATPAPSVIRAISTGDFDLQFAIDRCIDLMVTAAAQGASADCATGAISVPLRAEVPLPIDVAILRLDACVAINSAIQC